jgi:hypothetical protein
VYENQIVGHRFIKVAKSPISPPVTFPFVVEMSGITLLNQEGIGVAGSEINVIRCQGLIFAKCCIASRHLLAFVFTFFFSSAYSGCNVLAQ